MPRSEAAQPVNTLLKTTRKPALTNCPSDVHWVQCSNRQGWANLGVVFGGRAILGAISAEWAICEGAISSKRDALPLGLRIRKLIFQLGVTGDQRAFDIASTSPSWQCALSPSIWPSNSCQASLNFNSVAQYLQHVVRPTNVIAHPPPSLCIVSPRL